MIKTAIHRSYSTWRFIRDWLRTRWLRDGDHLLPFPVYHATLQPDLSDTYQAEVNLFGEAIARRWSRDGCGVAAIKSAVMSANSYAGRPHILPNISELSEMLYQSGAYRDKIGWIHRNLANFAKGQGLRSENYAGENVVGLCAAICRGRIPIVSVTLYFRGGEPPIESPESPPRPKGGHLVVLKGFRWNRGKCLGFFVDDSQNTSLREGMASEEFVGIERFNRSFSNKAVYVWAR